MISELKLNRLAVFKSGKPLFNESFHDGVNIIHGDNGSGKSTIADFIFYSLGGDLRDWKKHALLADFVLAEITAGNTVLTLRRDIPRQIGNSLQTLCPMQIFFGPYEKAVGAGPTGWQHFPYKRPESGFSFNQVLFRAIGIPEAISEGRSNITMHQLLRVLYVDQMTPIQRIFRAENFDSWEIRQAVGELLCGIGGYDLYDKQLTLRETEKEFDTLSLRLRNLISVASGYGEKVLIEHIEQAIKAASEQRAGLLERVSTLLSTELVSADEETADKLRKEAARKLSRAKRTVADIESKIEGIEYEVKDAALFLEHLALKLSQFDDAAATFFSMGQIGFDYCPSCFSPIADHSEGQHCRLCGSDYSAEEADAKALAVRMDIEMQISETTKLQAERDDDLRHLKGTLRVEKARLRRALEEHELANRTAPTRREADLAEVSHKIGFLESEIAGLQRRLELAREIEHLTRQKEELNSKISRLKLEIESLEAMQRRRKAMAYTAISENAKNLLQNDMEDQNDFDEIEKVSFSFSGDWVAINDDKNRSRSASGMVILKNSFMLGMLLSSMSDKQFTLPRFMLFDNIEDKGMIQERSWHFQKLLVNSIGSLEDINCQVIYTTSKIAPELADSRMVIGRKYTKKRPTLEFLQQH